MKVHLELSMCEGHGRCYALAPDVFVADYEGRGEVALAEVDTPELIAQARAAAQNCPESAIILSE